MTSRREAWGLTGISALFVLTGILLLAVEGVSAIAVVAIVFFGACLLVGVVQLVGLHRGGSGEPTGPLALLVMATASFLFAIACLLLLLFAVLDWEGLNTSPGRSRALAALAGGVGTVFFGGESGVLVVRAVLARRR